MKRRIIIRSTMQVFFGVILCTASTFSQPDTLWTRNYGSGEGNFISRTSDGGFIVTGEQNNDLLLFKTDSDGNLLWEKTYGGTENDFGSCVQETQDGGLIIAGGTETKTIYEGNYEVFLGKVFLAKTNELGDTLWTKTYYLGRGPSEGKSIVQTKDGGYVLVSNTGETVDAKVFLVRTDALGDTVWTRLFSKAEEGKGCAIFRTSDGGYMLAGHRKTVPCHFNFFILHTDSLGQIVWEKTFNSERFACCYDMKPTQDGGYILAGVRDYKIILLKTDEAGDSVWCKTYGEGSLSGWWDADWCVQQTQDGGYILLTNQSRLIKTDAAGDTIWTKKLEVITANSLVENADLSYVLTNGFGLASVGAPPHPVITGDSLLTDDNWDGYAVGAFSGDASQINPFGYPIQSYSWKLDGAPAGSGSNAQIEVPVGSHQVELEVKDEMGQAKSTWIGAHVASCRVKTGGVIEGAASCDEYGDNIYFCSGNGHLYCLDRDGKLQWQSNLGSAIFSEPVVDLDGRIYVGTIGHTLHAFEPSGASLWTVALDGRITLSPSIVPSGDLYVSASGKRLYTIRSETGETRWTFDAASQILTSVIISSKKNLYFGCKDGTFYSLNPEGGVTWTYKTGSAIRSTPALDFSGNIYFGSDDKKFYALSESGALLWSVQAGSFVRSSPVVDEYGNVYFVSEDSLVYFVDNKGRVQWTESIGSRVTGSPTIWMGGLLLLGCQNGRLFFGDSWYYQTNGEISASFLSTSEGRIFIGSGDGTLYGFYFDYHYDWDDPNIHSCQWPTYKGWSGRTGYQGDIPFSAVPNANGQVVRTFALKQNYPNPFNPSTIIPYELPRPSHVRIEIVDVYGRSVRTLIDERQQAGFHQVSWDGANDQGVCVASGVYIILFRTAEYRAQQKMILMR